MNGADVTVNINSPGGDMFEGLAIYNLLREYQGKVTVKVLGIAASAASVIAMAGDDIQIGRGAFLMIHNCWVVAMGTSNPVNPAPGDDLVKAVRDHILPLAPVAGGGLFVFAATEKSIPVTVALAKDTPEIRTAIIAELNALMLRDGAPSGKIYVSRISEAISLATGEVAHQLRVPAADVVLGKTELPVLGNIIWATYTGENG